MNWKFGIGLGLTIFGALCIATFWFAMVGIPAYLVGVIMILISGKPLKTKLMGIVLPLTIPLVLWTLFKLDIIN